jgi:hypothetical protein
VLGARCWVLRRASKCGDLLLIEISELAGANVVVLEGADAHAFEAAHGVTDGFKHPAHLPVTPLMDHDRHECVVSMRGFDALLHGNFRRGGPLAVEWNPLAQPFELVIVRYAADAHVVFPADPMPWMRETVCELAVVGQQQQSLGVVIEPADGINVITHATLRQQIDDRRPLFGI